MPTPAPVRVNSERKFDSVSSASAVAHVFPTHQRMKRLMPSLKTVRLKFDHHLPFDNQVRPVLTDMHFDRAPDDLFG